MKDDDPRKRYYKTTNYRQQLARDAVEQADALIEALHPQAESE